MFKKFGILFAVLMVMVLIGAGYAFANSNDVAKSNVGYGESTISGYKVSDVVYTYATNAKNLASIAFTVAPVGSGDPDATEVKINTLATASADYTKWACTVAGTTKITATCVPAASGTITTESVVQLDVAASSSTLP